MCCNSTIAVAELVGYRERKSFSFFILHSRLSLIKDSKNNTFAFAGKMRHGVGNGVNTLLR
jgi:hypothetical protein